MVFVYPTSSVWGIGADIYSEEFVLKVLNIKNSNSKKPTSILFKDEEQLAEYIYDYGLGMQTERTIELKKLDSDFWDNMQNDNKKASV